MRLSTGRAVSAESQVHRVPHVREAGYTMHGGGGITAGMLVHRLQICVYAGCVGRLPSGCTSKVHRQAGLFPVDPQSHVSGIKGVKHVHIRSTVLLEGDPHVAHVLSQHMR